MKVFNLCFWIDKKIDDNRIDLDHRIKDCIWEDEASCLRDALKLLYSDVLQDYDFEDKSVLIGISFGRCDGKPINCSYRNRLIYDDMFLNERFWC